MNRRGFLGSILALGVAPAIVRASSLMVLPAQKIVVPTLRLFHPVPTDYGFEIVATDSADEDLAAALPRMAGERLIRVRDMIIADALRKGISVPTLTLRRYG